MSHETQEATVIKTAQSCTGSVCAIRTVGSPMTHATARLLAAMNASAGIAVAFHLPTVRTVASDDQIRGMYFLSPEVDIDTIEVVAMGPGGAAFRFFDGSVQLPPGCSRAEAWQPTLFEIHAPDFQWLGDLGALCIGVGRMGQLPPVTLALNFEDGIALGAAVFASRPCGESLDLLAGIGVKLLKQSLLPDGRVLVQLENRLAAHFDAAQLSNYSRTHNCNLFFVSHANATGEIGEGLEAASRVRIAAGRKRLAQAVLDLSASTLESNLSLRLRLPEASKTRPYGDLVPLGFLGLALRRIVDCGGPLAVKATQQLFQIQESLEIYRIGGFWGYARNCIPTSTDTALVCLAGVIPDFDRLERLRGNGGGFTPQSVSEEGGQLTMKRTPATSHWEEEDVPTTALIEALRLEAGLDPKISAKWLLDRCSRWGGLFFTPPTMGLWAIARFAARLGILERRNHIPEFIHSSAEGTPRQDLVKLREVILKALSAYSNKEGGFGDFDPVLNNGFAVMALDELGILDHTAVAAQLLTLDAWEAPKSVEAPFYSTLSTGPTQHILEDFLTAGPKGSEVSKKRRHQVSLYEDPERLVVTAVAALALHVEADPGLRAIFPTYSGKDAGTLHGKLQRCCSPAEQSLHHVQSYCEPPLSIAMHSTVR